MSSFLPSSYLRCWQVSSLDSSSSGDGSNEWFFWLGAKKSGCSSSEDEKRILFSSDTSLRGIPATYLNYRWDAILFLTADQSSTRAFLIGWRTNFQSILSRFSIGGWATLFLKVNSKHNKFDEFSEERRGIPIKNIARDTTTDPWVDTITQIIPATQILTINETIFTGELKPIPEGRRPKGNIGKYWVTS